MDRPLEGQVALVTGASSGIGMGCARLLAGAGAAVAVGYRGHEAEARALVAEIEAAGGRAVAVGGDVSVEAEVRAVFDRVGEHLGGLDILIANSGIQRDAPFAEMSLEAWRRVIDVNLTGQFLCAREAIGVFDRQGDRGVSRARGKIVCMSSVHEVIPWAGHANYAAAKGGLGMMMRSLAQEVAGRGIRVNAIAPGAIETAINRDQVTGENADRVRALIPYGRIGVPEDVGRAAVWLASDDSDYVVGATLFVDGGMTLYPGFRDNG